jgi:hypothetical protein
VTGVCTAGTLALLLAGGWLPASAETSAPALDPSPLVVPQDDPQLLRLPALRERLRRGPHDYFRFINARFTSLVCERIAGRLASQPTVTLHGDAHLEQYSVTDRGRGLADFDDASLGPALIDLARFGVSIRLALRERGWSGAEAPIAAFLSGYAAALRDPRTEAPVPSPARRLAAGFDRNRMASLARAEALMEELPEGAAPREVTLEKAAQLLADAARLPASFFHVKKVGALRIGIGSAADEKYLFRTEGPSAAPEDDVILEVKEARTLPTLDCIRSEPGPTRILVSQARLAYEPFRYAGTLNLEGRYFWFFAWSDNYVELDIRRSLASAVELGELAYDVGVQLGRGHPKRGSEKEAGRLRKSLLASLPESGLYALTAELADVTEAAWRRFRAAEDGGAERAPN